MKVKIWGTRQRNLKEQQIVLMIETCGAGLALATLVGFAKAS
jgi:hypothetical protein